MLPDSDTLVELALLGAMAGAGALLGYAGIAWWETRHALYAGVAQPVPVTLDAHARVDRVAADVRVIMTKLEEYHAAHGRWPTHEEVRLPVPNSYPEFGPLVQEYAIGSDGRLRAALAGPGLDGRRVVFTPRVVSRGTVEWTCAAPEALREWLRSVCRS